MKRILFMVIVVIIISGCNNNMENSKEKSNNSIAVSDEVVFKETFNISSTAFSNNGKIPDKFTCDGEEVSPPITIKNIPNNTQSLVLIIDDPDAPMQTWDHWIVYNIPVTTYIAENSVPGTVGQNSWNMNRYGGPCPPTGEHRYFFKVYALDNKLSLNNPGKRDVENAMKGHILAQGELIGRFSRK